MTQRVLGPTGSPRRRWTLLLALSVVFTFSLFYVAGAQAVHDEEFQLDGNVLASSTTEVPSGNTQDVDWDSLFAADGSTKGTLPSGFDDANLEADFSLSGGSFVTSDGTTFATGSKDTLPISGWQCNFDNNVNSKIDVMNAYAATYVDGGGDDYLYFGIERNVNTGDANVGFWFLQDEVACSSSGGAVTFTGEHKEGDLLVVSEFSNGGLVSTINVYRWNRPDPSLPGSLNPTPVASGVDCRSVTGGVGDNACGAANTAAITTPWTTVSKTTVGTTLPEAQFFEGGLNLTQSGLAGKCFNTFLADTRSSTSLTATLFDYVGGTLGECDTELTTTASGSDSSIDNSNTTANGTASSGIDTATVEVNGVDTWGGQVKFYLCGPMSGTNVCDNTGVLVNTVNVSNATPSVASGDGPTLTSAGRYCWYGEFIPDTATANAGVEGATDTGGTSNVGNPECFTVSPVTPTLDTLAGTSPVDLGSAVTDSATLGGAAKEPGNNGGTAAWSSIGATNGAFVGTIGFTLKGVDGANPATVPADCKTTNANPYTGETQAFPITVNVTGNTTYGGAGVVSYKPAAPGDYHWVATYSHTATTVNNNLPVTHNATCQDGDEAVTVRQVPTNIKTKQSWYPNDTATVTSSVVGDTLVGGTLDFYLYDDATCGTGAGALKYSERRTLTGGANSEELGTRNYPGSTAQTPGGAGVTPFAITTGYANAPGSSSGSYSWKVVYTPSDTGHTGKQSACTIDSTEKFAITYTNDPGPGTNLTP